MLRRCSILPYRATSFARRAFSSGVVQPPLDVVHSPEPVLFTEMVGKADYWKKLQAMYDATDEAWLTPVEIFQPHYAHGVLAWILETHNRAAAGATGTEAEAGVGRAPSHRITDADAESGSENGSGPVSPKSAPAATPLHIIEIGGGKGTLARNILDRLRQEEPEVYARTRYTIVEISKPLHERQKDALTRAGHAPRIDLVNTSILDWDGRSDEECFIVALEVLDNMPHDKVVFQDKQPHQIRVETKSTDDQGQEVYSEITEPAADPLILQYLELRRTVITASKTPALTAARSVKTTVRSIVARIRRDFSDMLAAIDKLRLNKKAASASAALGQVQALDGEFLPTVTLRLLERLSQRFPRHNLLLADFDTLPSTAPGINGPVVAHKSAKTNRQTKDFYTYMVPHGEADIFFPTNFDMLAHVYRHASGGRLGRVWRHSEFMSRFGNPIATTTRTGFNPLLDDFKNQCFFACAARGPSLPVGAPTRSQADSASYHA